MKSYFTSVKIQKTKITLTIFAFLSFSNTQGQQVNFSKLIEMTSSLKTFEIEMIKNLNHTVKKDTQISYSYTTEGGAIGCSDDLPTNNTRYEKKYKFEDGIIYTQSEIEKLKLDESYERRNFALKQGLFINQAVADSFNFQTSKIISSIKGETTKSEFAENYNSERETATTWYSWESHKYTKIITSSKLFAPNSKKITIQYSNDSEFSKILNEIIAVSKYKETKDEYGRYVSYYQYNTFEITSERDNERTGGIITIKLEY